MATSPSEPAAGLLALEKCVSPAISTVRETIDVDGWNTRDFSTVQETVLNIEVLSQSKLQVLRPFRRDKKAGTN